MPAKIVHVDQGSPAEKAGISAGWWLQKINGHSIRDVLDYKFYSYDSRLELTLSQEKDGEEKFLSIGKAEDLSHGQAAQLCQQMRLLLY